MELTEKNFRKALNLGKDCLKKRNFSQAISICEEITRKYPKEPEAWFFASQVSYTTHDFQTTLNCLDKALELIPNQPDFLIFKANALLSLNNVHEARELCKKLDNMSLANLHFLNELASLHIKLKQYGTALNLYKKLIELKPDFSGFHYNAATTLRMTGDLQQAEIAINRAISLNPNDYEAIQFRSSLRKQTPENNHISELETILQNNRDNKTTQVHICYALAKESEDIGNLQSSFEYVKKGADSRRSMMNYHIDSDLKTINQLYNSYSLNFIKSQKVNQNRESNKVIFILGLPRTGSTLIESILGSHSTVVSAGELHSFYQQLVSSVHNLKNSRPNNAVEFIKQSTNIDFKKLGINYINNTAEWIDSEKFFIDKNPLNSLYIGLIHLALPQAKIIHVRRHPLDTCYAIYKNLFASAYPFSYTLDEIGQYYIAHHNLMKHWHHILPEKIHSIHYEEVVNDQKQQTVSLLNYCDLKWEEQCINFQENAAPSDTASASQIREPLYKSSVARWKKIETELKPLTKMLEKAGIDCS